MCMTFNNKVFLYAVDKKQLKESITGGKDENVRINIPYLLAYEYVITFINWYIKAGLQGFERGIAIVNRREEFEKEVKSITKYKKYNAKSQDLIKHLVEVTYTLDSKYNPIMQIAELICFIAKKHFEVEQGYRENYPEEVKSFFKEGYLKINRMVINSKSFVAEQKSDRDFYNKTYMINLIK